MTFAKQDEAMTTPGHRSGLESDAQGQKVQMWSMRATMPDTFFKLSFVGSARLYLITTLRPTASQPKSGCRTESKGVSVPTENEMSDRSCTVRLSHQEVERSTSRRWSSIV